MEYTIYFVAYGKGAPCSDTALLGPFHVWSLPDCDLTLAATDVFRSASRTNRIVSQDPGTPWTGILSFARLVFREVQERSVRL